MIYIIKLITVLFPPPAPHVAVLGPFPPTLPHAAVAGFRGQAVQPFVPEREGQCRAGETHRRSGDYKIYKLVY